MISAEVRKVVMFGQISFKFRDLLNDVGKLLISEMCVTCSAPGAVARFLATWSSCA